MKQKILCCIAVISLLLTLCVGASATAEQRCGETITWSLDGGTLTVSGKGEMYDFPDGSPWDVHKGEITHVVFTGGVTYVGACAFKDYDALVSIDFGSDLYEIGEEAFRDCDNLTVIHLPAAFKVFGKNCLRSCDRLTAIHSEGRFPTFRSNCLWDTYATIYFPAERPWGVEYIQQLEEAFNGRIEFLASDGSDPYDPSAETTAETTEATTEPTTETTEPSTEATTEPTDETTVPTETTAPVETTAAPTESAVPSTAPAVTVPQTQEPGRSFNWLGWLLGGIALVMLLALVWRIFAASRRQGKYSAKKKPHRK